MNTLVDDILNELVSMKPFLARVRWRCTEVENAPALQYFAVYQFHPIHEVPLAVFPADIVVAAAIGGAECKGGGSKNSTRDFCHLSVQCNVKLLASATAESKVVISD